MKKLATFLYEVGQLKRVKRSGWWLLGIIEPESVAEHSHRAAIIGYFLAKMEKVNVEKVVIMALCNDIHEARLNDLHKVGHRYIDFKSAETTVLREQLTGLNKMGEELLQWMNEFQERESAEANVARDADLLECAIQAREYKTVGYTDAQNWIDNAKLVLKTESAKRLIQEIENTDPHEWWRNLKKIER